MLEDELRDALDAGGELKLPATQCAAACVLGDITVVEQSGYSVGCYVTLDLSREIFVKNYFDGQEGAQYLCAAFYKDNRLFMSFNSGVIIVQPLPKDVLTRKTSITDELEQQQTFHLAKAMLCFTLIDANTLVGAGRDGIIYVFNVSEDLDQIGVPIKIELRGIDDILSF